VLHYWLKVRTTRARESGSVAPMTVSIGSADGPQTGRIVPVSAQQSVCASRDHAIAEIAEGQHGLITLAQLERAGLTASGVRKRAAKGRLHRVHLGVYSVGHRPLDLDGEKMAAVLGCGANAALSHASAAALWRLRADSGRPFDVTAPNRRGRLPVGIRAHRHGFLREPDKTSVRGIPCTSVARTLLDLAGLVDVSELRKAISEAEVRRILDLADVRALMERSGGRRGVARLRMVISELSPQTAQSRSYLERKFLAMCERAKLPPPEVNCRLVVGNRELSPDFLWRGARLIVESDGRETHDTASAFENDRLRDQAFSAADWQVIRCTWHQVLHEPIRLTKTIRTILDRRA
jgi:very-short-patch-repair endonuclease